MYCVCIPFDYLLENLSHQHSNKFIQPTEWPLTVASKFSLKSEKTFIVPVKPDCVSQRDGLTSPVKLEPVRQHMFLQQVWATIRTSHMAYIPPAGLSHNQNQSHGLYSSSRSESQSEPVTWLIFLVTINAPSHYTHLVLILKLEPDEHHNTRVPEHH